MKKIIVIIFTLWVSGSSSAQILSPAQMQNDLGILKSSWENLHPGLYRYNTPQQIDEYFVGLQKVCTNPLDLRQFYLLLSQLAQKIKCGHTFLNPLNLEETIKNTLLAPKVIPLFFEIVEGKKIVITHNLSTEKNLTRGDEITEINGIPVVQVIDSLLTVSRSDGNNSLGKKLFNIHETADEADNYSLFDVYFPLFFPNPSGSYRIKTQSNDTCTLAAVGFEERIHNYEKEYGKIPVSEDSFDYKIINSETAYMKFGTFAFWNSDFEPEKYVDSVFSDLSGRTEIKNLVIDIRNNEGGDNTGNYILSYITSKRIGCDDPDRACYRYQKIPDSLLQYLSTWDNSFKKPKDTSKFRLNELGLYEVKNDLSPCDYINPKPTIFKGNCFLLTNAKNSSAGYEMARNFKTNHLGKIIGETTGGSQQGINGGEFFFLTLPHSKIEIDLPLIFNYHPDKEDQGISPDHEIKNNVVDIANGKDTQMEFILNQLIK